MFTKSVLILAAVCFGTVACNAADEPVSYSVYGVASTDALALRAGPNSTAQKLADIPHDASGIQATGNATPSGDWAEVQYQGRRGWVSARFLAFGPAGGMQLPALLQCSGTEPFWGIKVSPSRTKADLNFLDTSYSHQITRAASAMNRNDIWIVKSRDNRTEISLIVRKESCSDGMSDRDYPYSAVALVPGSDIIAGCCMPGAQ
jgi:uncharacterized membrane protein